MLLSQMVPMEKIEVAPYWGNGVFVCMVRREQRCRHVFQPTIDNC